jgi:NAD(P)-dependent dehydrogenase (short-subunit alcohol dehydrogenase family)
MNLKVTRDLFDLHGQQVLLTGATGGLGRAITHAMAARGARVLVSDVDPVACEALAAELSPPGTALPADLSRPGAAQDLAEAALKCGDVDVLVCNAGVQGPAGPLGDTDDAAWDHVMGINLRSAVTLTSALAPRMAGRGGGSIVLMASIAGLRGNRSIGLYGLSKAALSQLARNLAVEWGPRGVRANAISPGLIETPLARAPMGDADFMRRRLAMTPLRRVGQPSEVAGVAVMLASAAGAFITGQNLVVDGGTLISDGS